LSRIIFQGIGVGDIVTNVLAVCAVWGILQFFEIPLQKWDYVLFCFYTEEFNMPLTCNQVDFIDDFFQQFVSTSPKINIIYGDCFRVLNTFSDNSIHAVVTDPPYGVKEYKEVELEKKRNGKGGIWRLPPSFDGHTRSPLPRFTALNNKDRQELSLFFRDLGKLLSSKLLPGGHLIIASNSFLSQIVYSALVTSGLEFRSEIIRLVQTLRGGDRPKNAEHEFPDVCTMPRGSYEPWGLFRKPIPEKMTVAECLRKYQTGALRRIADNKPFSDVLFAGKTSKKEREIGNHPNIKPQNLMRKLVYAALPLGKGVIVDPFMGSGSTLAAALHCGYEAIGIEKDQSFFHLAKESIIPLSEIEISAPGQKELF
jgi:site-specific DNA-methyltransferase (adenine-specific)